MHATPPASDFWYNEVTTNASYALGFEKASEETHSGTSTSGVYRFSRHPMYLSMILVYLGVSFAAASWLFFLITVAMFFLQRYQMLKEEACCIERFGQAYRDYMVLTARWFGLPSRKRDAADTAPPA